MSIETLVANLPQNTYKQQITYLLNGQDINNLKDYTKKFITSLEKFPPPVPFNLVEDDTKERNPDVAGFTHYLPIHVRFKWPDGYKELSWQIDGDLENLISPKRYWDLSALEDGHLVQNRTEASITVAVKENTNAKPKSVVTSMTILSQPSPKKPDSPPANGNSETVTSSYTGTQFAKTNIMGVPGEVMAKVEADNLGLTKQPSGTIGPDDSIPSPFIMPLHYYQDKDAKLGRQAAVEFMSKFVSSDMANVGDRKMFRWMIATLWNNDTDKITIPDELKEINLQWGPNPKMEQTPLIENDMDTKPKETNK